MVKYLLATLVLTCLLVACETPYTPPEGWLKHENHNHQYTVHYPQGWKLSNQGSPGLLFYVSSPKTSEHDHVQENVNLISQVVASETDIPTYITELEKKADSQLQNLKRISTEDIQFKGYPTVFSVYEAEVNEVRVKWEQYAWLKGDRVYILTYSGDISQFEVYRGLATEIIESLRFY